MPGHLTSARTGALKALSIGQVIASFGDRSSAGREARQGSVRASGYRMARGEKRSKASALEPV